MSKAVLISIRPEWCEKIAIGQKTIEIRKTRPKIDTPFKCFIYQTKHKWRFSLLRSIGNKGFAEWLESSQGKVIGEFICDRVISAPCGYYGRLLPVRLTGIRPVDMLNYADEKTVYGWHISNLVIYDKHWKLSEFYKKASCGAYSPIIGVCDLPTPCVETPNDLCRGERLAHPPQSWCYVEDTHIP